MSPLDGPIHHVGRSLGTTIPCPAGLLRTASFHLETGDWPVCETPPPPPSFFRDVHHRGRQFPRPDARMPSADCRPCACDPSRGRRSSSEPCVTFWPPSEPGTLSGRC